MSLNNGSKEVDIFLDKKVSLAKRVFLGQKPPGGKFSWPKIPPGQKVFWGRRSLGNRPLRVVQINMKNVEEYHLLLFYKFSWIFIGKKKSVKYQLITKVELK